MPTVQVALIGILSLFIASGSGFKCPEEEISRLVVCYYKSETPIENLNICSCTHLVFESATRRTDNSSLEITEDAKKDLLAAKEKKENLQALFTLVTKPENSSAMLKSENKTWDQIQEIANLLQESGFDGVELNLQFNSQDGVSKDSYASFVKDLSKTLSNRHRRVKREGYDVSERVQDDVTTAAYSTQSPKKSTSETPSLKSKSPKQGNRKTRENKGESSEEEAEDILPAEEEQTANPKNDSAGKFLVFVRLSVKPEIIAKKFDLKNISRYADILTVPTHDIANENENRVTYHPSRLMGLSDILNTDSILDFLTGMGAVKSKMVISLPASVLEFQLKDEHKNTPGSPSSSDPQTIDQSQLCSLFSKNNWTLERDEDLSAPYAFSGKTWLAFEDEISVNIKGKYILLRELGGGAVYPIDADVNDESCKNRTGSGGHLTTTLYNNFRNLGRKPRAVVLESLQEQIHGTGFSGIEAGVKLSEYRIVRVVDNSGAVHVIRKNTKTQFECSRQGYFSHPLGCNKFYRCVKFDQYSDEYTVFEYDCPAGLAFDERWEVCVWPGSLPHGAPCTGSSEIAPVPRSHYHCPSREGYYADPENCRWFFACLDHARDGVTPLTAYEFRCPFGLVFSEQKLACDWPWLVGGCGNAGAAGLVVGTSGGSSSATHTLTFVNGGNLEASYGQYDGNLQEEAAFGNFGKGFGSVLKETSGSYLGAQTAGFGYIAGQRDDNNNRASFASLPDYEISGGRIFNKGGLVLNQNVNTIGTSNGKIREFGRVNEQITGGDRYQGRSGGFAAQNIQIHEASPTTSGVLTSGDLSGHVSTVYHSPPTPKPFSVDLPSVQINEEGISDYLHHSTVASTTPRVTQGFSTTLSPAPSSTPKPSVVQTVTQSGFSFGSSPKVQVHRFDHPNSFAGGVSVNQAVSAGVSEAQSFKHASGGVGTQVVNEHVSFGSSQPGIHGIELSQGEGLGVGQSTGNSFVGFTGEGKQSVGISSVTPATLIFGRNEHSTISGGATAGPFVVQTKPAIQTVDFTSSRGLGVSHSVGNSYVGFTGEGKQSVGISSVTPSTLNFGRTEHSTISREQPIVPFAVTPKPGIHTVEFTPSGGLGVSQSIGNSYVGYTGEGKQSAGISSVTPATFNYGRKEQSVISRGQPAPSFTVTSKPEIHTVEFTPSGGLGVSQSIGNSYVGYTGEGKQSVGISSVTPATFHYGRKEQSVISGEQPIVPFAATAKPGIQTVQFTSSGGSAVSQPAGNSFVSFSDQGHESGISVGTSRTSGQPVSVHPTSQPSVYTFQSTGSGVSFSPTVAPKPAIRTFEQTSIDQEVYRELNLNKPLNSYGVPVVTPKTGIFSYESTRSGYSGSVPASQPVASIVTPRTEFHGFSQGGAEQKLFSAVTPVSKVSFEGPGVTPTTPRTSTLNYNVGQSVRVALPTQTVEYVTPKTVNSFVHTSGHSSEGAITENPDFGRKSSFRYGGDGSSFGFSVSKSEIHQPAVQPSSGSPFSYSGDFNQLGSQSPKAEFFDKHEADVPSNVVTHVSVEQQPIVSVGTVSSINYDRGVSTGKPFTSTAFTPSPPLTNFHSTYLQPEHPAPSPAPTASKNLFYQSSVQPLDVSTFSKTSQSVTYEQQQVHAQPTRTKILSPAPGTFVNQPQTVNFDQKVINFNEKVKSFTPSVSRSFSSGHEINTAKPPFLDQSYEYLTPVTPKVFVSQTPQSLPVTPSSISFGNSFEVTGNEKRLQHEQGLSGVNENFGFVRTETVAPQRVDHVEVSTAAPEFKKRPVTSKPFFAQEQLLEFSKSVEVNPGQFFESTKTYFPSSRTTPATPLVIQQQPVRLIGHKTFKEKDAEGSYYQQGSFDKGEGFGHVQINAISEGGFEDQNAFNQGVGQIKTPGTNGIVYEQKEFFQQVVTPKTVYVPSADTPKTYAFPAVTPKAFVPSAVTRKVYASPTPRTYLQPAVTQEIYKSSGSSENYLLPELTSNAYGVPEAHAPSGVTSKSYFSSVVTPKTFLQSAVTEEAFGPSAEPPRSYLFPAVTSKTYAGSVVTPKAPVSPSTVYSGRIENVTPVTSGIVLPAQKEVVLTKTKTVNYLPPAGVSVTPNILVPSTTQAPPDFLSPLTEEISIQQHNNFEFQKVRGGEVNFIPSTTKSPPSFAPSGHFRFNQAHNFTSGHSIFGSGTGYSINPKIEIPEPPKEYFLAQDAYTRRPSPARVSKFKPSKSESGYLPPEVTTPKATLISVGAVDDHGDNIQQLLNKYSGGFDQVIGHESFGSKVVKGNGKGEIEFGREGSSTVRYEVSSSRQRGRGRQYHGTLTSSALPATNKYEEYEIEKENQRSLGKDGEPSKTTLDLNIGLNKLDKNKKTVIVVSQVSDANPILVGKLAGQCSCQSNMLEIRSKGKSPGRRGNQNQRQVEYPAEGGAQSEETVLIGGGKGVSYQTEQSVISSTTASYPKSGSPSILSSLGTDGVLPITPESLFHEARLKNKKKVFRGTTRYLPVPSDFGGKFLGEGFLLSPVPASEIASTVDYGVLEGGESRAQNEIEGGRGKAVAGAAFDRYGPGGWRSYDETLQGSVDCKRPGLFRHPKHCNKFYACNYDPWKERYTLHVFNCPIQLTYDSSISACNWPIRGPACADDNLLV